MNRLALFSAVAVLALGGVAIAQTPPPVDEPEAPAVEATPDAAAPVDEAAPVLRPMRPGRPGGPGMGMMRPHGGMMQPPADFTLPDTKGAVFVFDGPGRGRIIIKCADEDSTQSCAEAVKPLLDTITSDRGPGRGPGMGQGMGMGPGQGMGRAMGGPGNGNGPCMGQGPGAGQGMGRGPCGGGMGPGGPGNPAQPDAPAQNQ